MYESKLRSLVKTVVWRIIATLITLFTLYYYTGDFASSARTTVVAAAIGVVVFYDHERIWNRITWGKSETLQ